MSSPNRLETENLEAQGPNSIPYDEDQESETPRFEARIDLINTNS